MKVEPSPKRKLIINPDDLTVTARDLAAVIAESGRNVFDRAGPVQIVEQADGKPPRALRLTADGIVLLAHAVASPVVLNGAGTRTPRTLPERVARLYLALGSWGLPPLIGITSGPLLFDDGRIRSFAGYDPVSALWCPASVEAEVPENPTLRDARSALAILRSAFRTFPFADADMVQDGAIRCIASDSPPRQDESAFLTALLTAICRPSLPLVPGLLINAPTISGAGTGKGNLVRAISRIAYDIEPRAFTAGNDRTELDKRIASALIEASPVLFIDNVNGTLIRSDLLASVLTERAVDVRPLGSSRMLPLRPNAFVAVTGNGVTLSEDLARRFIVVELDARTEDPEARPFPPGFLRNIATRRNELLSAALTIWRWGRQNEPALSYGRPLGSFEEWGRWVRDPLLALGCADPAERVRAIKRNDPARRSIAEISETWWKCHADRPIKAAELSPQVRNLIDPQNRGRQFVASFLSRHVGTCVAGLLLTAQEPVGKWGTTTYAVRRTRP